MYTHTYCIHSHGITIQSWQHRVQSPWNKWRQYGATAVCGVCDPGQSHRPALTFVRIWRKSGYPSNNMYTGQNVDQVGLFVALWSVEPNATDWWRGQSFDPSCFYSSDISRIPCRLRSSFRSSKVGVYGKLGNRFGTPRGKSKYWSIYILVLLFSNRVHDPFVIDFHRCC